MNINQAFPSNFLRESDLGGKERELTVREVKIEDVGEGEHKPVLYFKSVDKGLVLNKTNANNLIAGFNSEETTDWQARSCVLYPTTTEFKGKTVPCIRVRVTAGAQAAAAPLGNAETSIFPPDV